MHYTLTNSLICVGLDSEKERLPTFVQGNQFEFNKAIIEATADNVCAYKINTAFYESQGVQGIDALKRTCDYVRNSYPSIAIIIDAKRGDIGNSSEQYARFVFDYLQADAVTLHPYLGKEALSPFLERKDKDCIILCKTSNPGSGEFQNLEVQGKPLYLLIAETVSTSWNTYGNCSLVVGATYPQELAEVRQVVGDMTLLIPGIGAQGGDIEQTLAAGMNSQQSGVILTVSRSVVFASSGADYAEKARQEVIRLNAIISTYKEEHGDH